MKPIRFCIGDYRSGEKNYRIIPVSCVKDALHVAESLGYEIIAEESLLKSQNKTETMLLVAAILEAIEQRLHGIENIVACYRFDYSEAQRLKQHFMNSDIRDYFPKILDEPAVVEGLTSPSGEPVYSSRRTYQWVTDYWCRVYDSAELTRPYSIIAANYRIYHSIEVCEKNDS